jgi:hypothetical protein
VGPLAFLAHWGPDGPPDDPHWGRVSATRGPFTREWAPSGNPQLEYGRQAEHNGMLFREECIERSSGILSVKPDDE